MLRKIPFALLAVIAAACVATLDGALAQQQYDPGGKAKVSLYCTVTTPGDTKCPPSSGGGAGVQIAPTSAAAAAPSEYVSGAAESNHVVKNVAGNLYSAYCYSTAAGLCMVFNSTTVPGDGAVTPIDCFPVSANNFTAHDLSPIPDQYGTGISIAFSTGTNCFSKTASATAFFQVRYK